MKIVCVRLPDDLRDDLEKRAGDEHRSLSSLIRYILYDSLTKTKKKPILK